MRSIGSLPLAVSAVASGSWEPQSIGGEAVAQDDRVRIPEPMTGR